MTAEPVAAPDRVALMDERVAEVLRLVRRADPEPACWMSEDACTSYCWECAQIARAKQMGLCAPVPAPPCKFSFLRTEREDAWQEAYDRFREGIDGGYWGQGEHDSPEHCGTCGKVLAYTLTDYGTGEEIGGWLECRIPTVGAGWHPVDSYALDRVHISLSWNPAASMVEGVISIATAALATTL